MVFTQFHVFVMLLVYIVWFCHIILLKKYVKIDVFVQLYTKMPRIYNIIGVQKNKNIFLGPEGSGIK